MARAPIPGADLKQASGPKPCQTRSNRKKVVQNLDSETAAVMEEAFTVNTRRFHPDYTITWRPPIESPPVQRTKAQPPDEILPF
jgi:hypothetical protein